MQELQPAPGCAIGDSFPDRAETLAWWEANYANDRLEYFQLQIYCKKFNTEFKMRNMAVGNMDYPFINLRGTPWFGILYFLGRLRRAIFNRLHTILKTLVLQTSSSPNIVLDTMVRLRHLSVPAS